MKKQPYRMPCLRSVGVGYLLFYAILCGSILLGACAGQSEITKAFNTINAVSAVRNGLQPIYAEVVKQHPELSDELVAFDAELYNGISSAYETLILIQQGEGTLDDYRMKLQALVSILDRYKVEEKVPALKGGIDLMKKLLGVA